MATAIDTLATYDAIAASGLDEKAARAISKAIADSFSSYPADLATKADLAAIGADIAGLKMSTKSDLNEFKSTTRADFAELRELIATTQNRTLIWMFGMLVTFSGIIVGFIKLT